MLPQNITDNLRPRVKMTLRFMMVCVEMFCVLPKTRPKSYKMVSIITFALHATVQLIPWDVCCDLELFSTQLRTAEPKATHKSHRTICNTAPSTRTANKHVLFIYCRCNSEYSPEISLKLTTVTDLLTPCSKVILENLIVAQLVKKFPVF
jgi:hypothetical protein